MRRNRVALDQRGTRCVVLDGRDEVQTRLTAYELDCARTADPYHLAFYASPPCPQQPRHVEVTLRALDALGGDVCYALHCKTTGLVKVGRSADLMRRWARLETQGGRSLQLVAVWRTDNSRDLERALHARFAAHHALGEWFDARPVIAALKATLGATPERPRCECRCRYDEHDHRPDDARPRDMTRRCLGFDSYGCPCQCPGYEPVPDEDSIDPDDAGGVSEADLDELDDLCRGRSVATAHRITSAPEEDLDA